jgi:hypothetical protein
VENVCLDKLGLSNSNFINSTLNISVQNVTNHIVSDNNSYLSQQQRDCRINPETDSFKDNQDQQLSHTKNESTNKKNSARGSYNTSNLKRNFSHLMKIDSAKKQVEQQESSTTKKSS